MQLELLDVSTELTAAQIPVGTLCMRKNKVFMRVAPRSYLLNSTLISDSLAAGKVFVTDMENGSLLVIKGDETVEKLDKAKLVFRR